jgi:predicted lipoprotein with Yx(FWY)xxD motif
MNFVPRSRIGSARAAASLGIGFTALVISACGASSSPSAASSSNGSGAAAGSPMTVSTAQTPLGSVLTGPNGNTVYTLVSAQGTPLSCTGSCLTVWPPVTATAGTLPHAGSGVSATLAIAASVMQITADGAPLYYFSGDSAAGQTFGQGIKSFGGTWYAVGANGQAVKSSSGATTTPTSSGSIYGY